MLLIAQETSTEIASAAMATIITLPNWSAFQPSQTAMTIRTGSKAAGSQSQRWTTGTVGCT